MNPAPIVAAEFVHEADFLAALRALRVAGCTRIETSAPYAVEGAAEIVDPTPTRIGWLVLLGALLGGSGGYLLQWWAARDYPVDVGGRPLHSWPAFVPVTFELTVLAGALVGVAGLMWLCGLPRLDAPLADVPGIARASQDRFFVGVRSDDGTLNAERLRRVLAAAKALNVYEVSA